MTNYAMDIRGTQHVRPRPRVGVRGTRRPQAHPSARQAPVARPRQVELAGTRIRGAVAQGRSVAPTPCREGAAVSARMANLLGVAYLSTLVAAAVTLVSQFLLVTG